MNKTKKQLIMEIIEENPPNISRNEMQKKAWKKGWRVKLYQLENWLLKLNAEFKITIQYNDDLNFTISKKKVVGL